MTDTQQNRVDEYARIGMLYRQDIINSARRLVQSLESPGASAGKVNELVQAVKIYDTHIESYWQNDQ